VLLLLGGLFVEGDGVGGFEVAGFKVAGSILTGVADEDDDAFPFPGVDCSFGVAEPPSFSRRRLRI
jgi:hypothetical protein